MLLISSVQHGEERPPAPSRIQEVLLVLGFVLLAANLRHALTYVAPLIGLIRTGTGISNGSRTCSRHCRSWRSATSSNTRRERWVTLEALVLMQDRQGGVADDRGARNVEAR